MLLICGLFNGLLALFGLMIVSLGYMLSFTVIDIRLYGFTGCLLGWGIWLRCLWFTRLSCLHGLMFTGKFANRLLPVVYGFDYFRV